MAEDAAHVPMMDLYAASSSADETKTRPPTTTLSSYMSLGRFLASLNPFAFAFASRQYLLPRYDIQSSEAAAPVDCDNNAGDDDVPLIAVTAPGRQESSYDLDSNDSSCDDASSWSSSDDLLERGRSSRRQRRQPEEVLLFEKGSTQPRHAWILRRQETFITKEIDVQAYMAKREMTALQEKWNALTMIPHPLLCFYFIAAGLWIPTALVQALSDEVQTTGMAWPDTWMGEPSEC